MSKFRVSNISSGSLQLNIKTLDGTKTITVGLHKGKSLELLDSQITGDIQVKLRRKLIKLQLIEKTEIITTFETSEPIKQVEKQPVENLEKRKKTKNLDEEYKEN